MVSFSSKRVEDLLKFGIGVMMLIILNQLLSNFFFRIDLTEEKRYTLTQPTRDLLNELDDIIYVEVYLAGDLPAGFKRLQNSIQETLDEFRIYSGNRLQYQFIDPDQAASQSARQQFYNDLANRGIPPTNLFANENGQRTEKYIFPGAILSYGGREKGVILLKGNAAASAEERLNQSIEGLEFELASVIQELANLNPPTIGLVTGHGELEGLSVTGLMDELSDSYDIFTVDPSTQSLEDLDAIIVAKPTRPFSEQDKYKIDQFIVNGGRALFFLDRLNANMDSVSGEGTLAFSYELELDDLLFKYGIRVNHNLIQDLQSGKYPVVVGRLGDQPQVQLLPWPYFPVINSFGNHPIVRNLDALYSRFASTIDTVKAEGIKKTPLLFTSQYSRALNAPLQVSLNSLRGELVPEKFQPGFLSTGYLLEGAFASLYKNRFLPEGVNKNDFQADGKETKILIVSDGDFLRNDINKRTSRALPLGLDPVTEQTYANAEFVENALNYMINSEGIILARNKEVRIRPLDKTRIGEEKTYWQGFNLNFTNSYL